MRSMRRLPVLLATAAMLSVLVVAPASAQTGFGPPAPSANIGGLVSITPGGEVTVRGADWPTPGIITVSLCGNSGIGGSASCDLPGLAFGRHPSEWRVPRDVDGRGAADVLARASLLVTSSSTVNKVSIPVKVAGVEERKDPIIGIPPVPETSLGIRVLEVRVRKGARRSWFGVSPERTVVVEVRNSGSEPTGQRGHERDLRKGRRPGSRRRAPRSSSPSAG